jgi:hypothetical protein
MHKKNNAPGSIKFWNIRIRHIADGRLELNNAFDWASYPVNFIVVLEISIGSGGFDLDAVAVVRESFVSNYAVNQEFKVFPTLAAIHQKIHIKTNDLTHWNLHSLDGIVVKTGVNHFFDVQQAGVYLLVGYFEGGKFTQKICVH